LSGTKSVEVFPHALEYRGATRPRGRGHHEYNKVIAQNPAFFTDLHTALDRLDKEFSDRAVGRTGTGAVFTAGLDFDHHFPLFARRSLKEIDACFDTYRATNVRLFAYPRRSSALGINRVMPQPA
jgi:hypothetical protein